MHNEESSSRKQASWNDTASQLQRRARMKAEVIVAIQIKDSLSKWLFLVSVEPAEEEVVDPGEEVDPDAAVDETENDIPIT